MPRCRRSPSSSPAPRRDSAPSPIPTWPSWTPACRACFLSSTNSAWRRPCALGFGLKAEIHLNSAFDRKNYFYPDLPQGYQISQLYHPIVGEGEVLVEMGDGTARTVRIERIHLEQDAGKKYPRHGPRHVLRRPQPHGRRADGDRLAPRYPRARGGGGLCLKAAADHALSRHLRRQHAERQPARRRERVDLPAGSV